MNKILFKEGKYYIKSISYYYKYITIYVDDWITNKYITNNDLMNGKIIEFNENVVFLSEGYFYCLYHYNNTVTIYF